MLSNEEKLQILVSKSKETLTDIASRSVPENDKFRPVYVSFDVPDTMNEAMLIIQYDPRDCKDKRILSVSVHHKNSDRLFSNFMTNGSKQEIIDYLACDNDDDIIKSVSNLSHDVDDYFSSL